MIQLRNQPYVGVTGVDMQPAMVGSEGAAPELSSTPLLRGIVKSAEGCHLVLSTTDPDPDLRNDVLIDLNSDRDIGYITTINAKLVISE